MSRATKQATQESAAGHPPGRRPPRARGRQPAAEGLSPGDGDGDGPADAPLLTLKEMVRGARTTARAVRFYEEQHLIRTVGRSPGGHRLFAAEELPKLQLVLELRTCGFSIEEIREILEAKGQHGTVRDAAVSVQRILRHHIDELHRKIETIERLGKEFDTSVKLLERCATCTDPRGPSACLSCDLPRAQSTPESFCHIWRVPPSGRRGDGDGDGDGKKDPA